VRLEEHVALSREAADDRSPIDRSGRTGVIVQYPSAEGRADAGDDRGEHGALGPMSVIESRLRDEARLEGVRLAAREMAHLLNNDLAVAVGYVDLIQAQIDLPPHLLDLLRGASRSLHAATRHVQQMQAIVQVVVKDTPAGQSLDLERSRRA
jgi:signal transduction histidine kinase